MKEGIDLSLFAMFDSDNNETNVTNNSVENTNELSLFDLLELYNGPKSNNDSVDAEDTLNNNDEEIIINNENEEICVGIKVYVEYDNTTYIGEVHSIYNDGNTVNVIFENKHSAFHISKVKKL